MWFKNMRIIISIFTLNVNIVNIVCLNNIDVIYVVIT